MIFERRTCPPGSALSLSNGKLSTPVKKHLPRLLVVDLSDDEDEADYPQISINKKSPSTDVSNDNEILIIAEKLSPTQRVTQEDIVILDSDSEDDEPLISRKQNSSKSSTRVLKMMEKKQQQIEKEIIQASAKTPSKSLRMAQLLQEETLSSVAQPSAKTRRQSRIAESCDVTQQLTKKGKAKK